MRIYGFLTLKKLENIENAGTGVNNYNFAKDRSIRASLFKGWSSIMGEKIIGNCYLRLFWLEFYYTYT